MRLEHATQHRDDQTGRIVRALAAIHELQPDCAHCRRRAATTVLNMTGAGEPKAVCAECVTDARLDIRLAQQRAERAAMRSQQR